MKKKVVDEFMISKCDGKAFKVKKGQVLRIIQVEGLQAVDMIAFNLHDFRESLSVWLTRHLSQSFTRAKKIYTKLPAANVMFTVLNERPGIFWLSQGRCNKLYYKVLFGRKGYHKNCQDILTKCIKPYGMTEYDVPEVFNIFMSVSFTKDGKYKFRPAKVKKCDCIDLLAEMDCLVAISACPDDIGCCNNFKPKPLKIQLLE